MLPKCQIEIVINNISKEKAKVIEKALEPDNVDFPQGLSFTMNEKNIAIAIDDLIKSLDLLKDKIGKDPNSLQTFLGELKDFKESNY